jgi:hypothetical protein
MAGNNQMVASKQSAGAGRGMEHAKQFWVGLRPQQRIYLGVGLFQIDCNSDLQALDDRDGTG